MSIQMRKIALPSFALIAILIPFAGAGPSSAQAAPRDREPGTLARTAEPVAPLPDNGRHGYSSQDEIQARVMLGELMADIAVGAAQTANSAPAFHQVSALLQGAMRMNPYEPRYPLLLAEAFTRQGDMDGAVQAWIDYRKLLPNDQVAQVRIIDLYLARLQTADAKIKYINELIARNDLAPEVKAHVAVTAVPLLQQRWSRAEALAMLQKAKSFYPLPEVALVEWGMLPPNTPPRAQLPVLMDRLMANPADADATGRVADLLAQAGLSDQASNWYAVLMDDYYRQNAAPPMHYVVNSLAESYRSGEITATTEKLDQVIAAYPDDPDVASLWMLRLTLQRNDESAQLLSRARRTLAKRLDTVSNEVLKLAASATQPATQPTGAAASAPSTRPGNVSATPASDGDDLTPAIDRALARANQLHDPRVNNMLAGPLYDLAWFELYFNHRPEAALPWISDLRKLLANDAPMIRELEGWYDLVAGHAKEARAELGALQATDPLAALGLFDLEEQQHHEKEAQAIGSKILSEPGAGVVGAMLYQATKGRGLKPSTQPALAAAIGTMLDKFPMDWLEVVRNPRKFYAVRAKPVKASHKLGEPFLATITIQNNGKHDITVGEFGLLKPTLIFDAQIRTESPLIFPGVAISNIMGRLVLRPGDRVSQVVRIDQGRLSDALRRSPAMTLRVVADVITNPRPENGRFPAGAAGYPSNFETGFTRSAELLRNEKERRRFIANLERGAPAIKILSIEALAAYVREDYRADSTPAEKLQAQQYMDIIEKERSDPAPGVKIWANFDAALLYNDINGQKVIDEMIASNSWESRLMALVAARYLPAHTQNQIAEQIVATDKDAVVRTYAKAVQELTAHAEPASPPPAAPDASSIRTQPSRAKPGPEATGGATEPGAAQPATGPSSAGPALPATRPAPALPNESGNRSRPIHPTSGPATRPAFLPVHSPGSTPSGRGSAGQP